MQAAKQKLRRAGVGAVFARGEGADSPQPTEPGRGPETTICFRFSDYKETSVSYNISRKEMIEPVERMYEREYGSEHGMFHVLEEEGEDGEEAVTLTYIQGDSNHLHIIRIEDNYDDCMFNTDRGLFSLRDVDANYRWIALPLYALREGEEEWNDRMKSECDKRDIGIITAQKKGRGVSAKIIQTPDKKEGNFLSAYDKVQEEWEQKAESDAAPEGFKVVDYYKR